MQTLKTIFENELDRLISIQQFQEPASALSSGFKHLDRAINGFRPQHLYLLGSMPQAGKTAFLLNLLLNITVKKQTPSKALLYSLDISAAEVAQRLLCCNSSITLDQIFYGVSNTAILEKIYVDVDQIKHLSNNLLIDDYPICTIELMRKQLQQLKEQNQMPAIVVIDNINRIVLPDANTEKEAKASLMELLKQLAFDFNIPLLVSTEVVPVTGDIDEDIYPRLSALRKNNIYLHVVDVVMFLMRPEYYRITEDREFDECFDEKGEKPNHALSRAGNPLPKGFGEMHLNIALNRCGPTAIVYFNANMETQQVLEDGGFNS